MPSKSERPSFPVDREWTRISWERVLASADRLDPETATLALDALRAVFPAAWIDSGLAQAHPLAMEQHWYAGRLVLLELGLAIALLGLGDADLERLREPAEYRSTAAEMRARLLLRRAGATTEPPAARVGRKRCEWIARWPDGVELAIEVKLPDVSARTRVTYAIMGAVADELAEQIQVIACQLPGVRATLNFGPGWGEVIAEGAVKMELLKPRVAEVVARLNEATRRSAPFGRHALGLLGTLELQLDPQAQRLVIHGHSTYPRRVAQRLTRGGVLAKAAKQIEDAGIPGVIVLDIEDDVFARNALPQLVRWLERRPQVAAILMLDRTVMPDGKLYGTADIVPGQSVERIAPVLAGLDVCASGHLHYNPLCVPSEPCPMTWLGLPVA